jgi:hypothetical protein
MLPFTKRPGRGGEDGEVFTKDDLDDLAATNEKPSNAAPLSRRPPAHVAKPDDFGDDEVTNFIPSKSVSAIVHDARKPATIPPPPASRRPPASVPPPPMSQRPGKFLTAQVSGADEDEDGRTVVRGAPKIVKKSGHSVPPPPSQSPASMSPAAVIKATLESARAAKRANEGALMPPPPAELLEDMTDRLAPDDPRLAPLSSRSVGHAVPPPPHSQRPPQMMQSPYTAPMGMTPMGVSELGATMLAGMGPNGPHSQPPPSSHGHGPMTGPPPPMHLAHGYPPPSPSGSIPPPPQSYRPPNSYANGQANQTGPHQMPAHFMVPNAPYSDGRIDPPGTSVTARHRTPGRPASAWAMALVAAGLFVGVGAVAVMQSNDSLMDTTASFVDPSRAAPKAAAQPVAEPVPQAAPTTAIAPTVVVPPAVNPEQPPAGGVIGASAPAAPPPVAAPAPAPAPVPEAKPEAKPAAVAANPAPAAPKTTWIAPTPKAQAPAAAAPAPAPKPAAAPKPAVASNEDAPEKPAKPSKSKPGKGDATDEETKKALEALQKAQLESGF